VNDKRVDTHKKSKKGLGGGKKTRKYKRKRKRMGGEKEKDRGGGVDAKSTLNL